MLLPFLLGLLFIKIYHADYQNDTLKELLQIPVTMNQLFYAKILFLFLASVIIMLPNCLLIMASAVICRITDISILATALATGNTIFSSTVCLYSMAGIIGVSQLAGTHPISSMLNILFGNQLTSITSNGENLIYIADIVLFVFITAVSVTVFYGIKHGDKYKQKRELFGKSL